MSQHLGFRCPDDIAEIIEQRAKATGKPRTDIIVDLLRYGLQNEPVEQRKTPVEQNSEHLQELIDNKTRYLADAMNEARHLFENRAEVLTTELRALEARLAQQEEILGKC